jgi:hypothetical protein
MNIADTIQKVKEAGFHLAVDGDDIIVTPPGKLSDQQRDYLRAHKPEIISALRASDSEGGNDLPAANDDRITVSVPEFTLSTGQRVSFDLDVPKANLPALRRSLRFELKDGQGGGSILGRPGGTEEHLRDVLVRKYERRLASINGMEVCDD